MIIYVYATGRDDREIRNIIELYRQAGWWGRKGDDLELVSRLIAGSHCFLLASNGAEIVGMGRAISDRASDAYLQDVTVRLPYRGRGIGTEIIRRLVARLREDGIKWIGLIAEKNSFPFYQCLGFKVMSDSTPMVMKAYD